MRNILKGPSKTAGMMLIEALVAIAIFGLVLVGPLALFQSNWKSYDNSKLQGEAFSILHEMRSILSTANQCQINYGGITLSADPQGPNGNKITSTNPAISDFVVGLPRNNQQTRLVAATISQIVPYDPSTPLRGISQFQVRLQFPDDRITSWTIPMYVEVDAAGVVQKCRAGSWFKPLWEVNNGALTYNGIVGIGTTPVANQPLTINGSIMSRGGWGTSPIGPTPASNAFDISNGRGTCFTLGPITMIGAGGWASANTAAIGGNGMNPPYAHYTLNAWGYHLDGSLPAESWNMRVSGGNGILPADRRRDGLRLTPSLNTKKVLVQSQLIVGNLPSAGNDFYVNGNAGGQTPFNVGSDLKTKKDIREISDPSSFVEQLRPVRFNFKETGKTSIGFIAQDVKKILPAELNSLVSTKGPYWSMKYSELIPILVKTLQGLRQKQINLEHDQSLIISALCAKYTDEASCHAQDL